MNVRLVQLPLMQGDVPAADIASQDAIYACGAVVAQRGDDLLLVDTSAITATALGGGGPTTGATLWDVGGMPLTLVTIEDAAAAEQDASPASAFLALNPHAPLLASPMATTAIDLPSVVVSYVETYTNFHLGQRVYRCSAGNEAYNEGAYFRLGGVCPQHGAALR